ncbi:gag-pol polyprotein [Cucumis melo var. makuwa]|uniref:Gag-pol polyprotein n=1 Tax=Cucumis melo var. makuwa TaxID=1194695 RepID=A0A5D3BQP6_CUCMM|nr:gag-pol polyprotein [Cucumis melo var. makuwa]TYK01494.1 gag-pol polyprotein [Cucumis melo var. makuwa]
MIYPDDDTAFHSFFKGIVVVRHRGHSAVEEEREESDEIEKGERNLRKMKNCVWKDGIAWRTLVAGYKPPMITVDGVSVPKSEVDWTDAKEQVSVGSAKALNFIFNGVDLNVFKLINSCNSAKEA